MNTQSNVTHMLVGKDLDILTSAGTKNDLAVGQIGVFKAGKNAANGASALAAGDRFSIAVKNSLGVIVETPLMDFSAVKAGNGAYSAPILRSRALGFNGTSGSIAVSDSTNYVVHVFYRDSSKDFGRGNLTKFAAYPSGASATQAEIAAGLTASFIKNFSREEFKLIKAETLINSAGAAMTGTGTLTVKNGSKYATAGTAAEAVLTVGDYVRIGGTAVSDPAYKVLAINTTNDVITLNAPYQGADAVVAEASTEVITAANAAAANAGVKLTALPLTGAFEAGIIRYDVLDFTVQLGDGFGGTDVTQLTGVSKGQGVSYDIAQQEWFAKGIRGEAWRQGSYPKDSNLQTDMAVNYNQVNIAYATGNVNTLDRTVLSYGTVKIAVPTAGSNNIYASLQTVLGL